MQFPNLNFAPYDETHQTEPLILSLPLFFETADYWQRLVDTSPQIHPNLDLFLIPPNARLLPAKSGLYQKVELLWANLFGQGLSGQRLQTFRSRTLLLHAIVRPPATLLPEFVAAVTVMFPLPPHFRMC